jgi:hypothetical protein
MRAVDRRRWRKKKIMIVLESFSADTDGMPPRDV